MSPRGTWLREGMAPLPSPDKILDRAALTAAGGLTLIEDRRVLDVGPCCGEDARDFAPAARLYVALDYEELVLEWLASYAPGARRVLGDARGLPFRAGAFDTVLDFGTLDNVGDPPQGYREACRVLAPAGILLTAYGNAHVLGPGDGVGEIYSEPEVLAALLRACGMAVVSRSQEEQPRAVMVAQKSGAA